MKDKEMIEEMASIICESTSNRGTCNECGFKRHERFGFIYQCHNFDSAERIYNAGYRKAPEGAVVLSEYKYIQGNKVYSAATLKSWKKEDLIKHIRILEHNWANAETRIDNQIKNFEILLKQERKETAKEILQEILLMVSCWDGRNVHINHDELVELGKKYDVDMRVVEE